MIAKYNGSCACGCGTKIVAGQTDIRYNGKAWIPEHFGRPAAAPAAPAKPVYRPAKDGQESWSAAALLIVAGMDGDRATALNGVGFNKQDGDFGHAMAEKIQAGNGLTDKMWAAVVKIARKYRRQVVSEINECPEAGTPVVDFTPAPVAAESDYDGEYDAEIAAMRRDEAEYQAGVQDAKNYQENVRWFGRDVAESLEIERELRFGGDY